MKTEHLQDELENIASRLKFLRIKQGFSTCEEFAIEYDLPKNQYRNMENGSLRIALHSLIKVLEAHNLSLEEFFCMDLKKAAA